MAMNIADITFTGLETISMFDIATGAWIGTLDELQNFTISQSEETTDITGKQGRLLARLKKNKSISISGTNGLVSGGLMEVQSGSSFENKVTEVLWTGYHTVNDNASATDWVAVGTTGAEIEGLYIKNSDGTLGDALTQGDEVAEGVYTYDPSTKALAFSGIEDGTEIVVFYKRKVTASVLENASDSYSGKCAMYADALGEDKCGNVFRVQFYIPKADFSGEFSLEIGDSQTVHSFEASALAGACGTAGQFFTYTVFGSKAEDAE